MSDADWIEKAVEQVSSEAIKRLKNENAWLFDKDDAAKIISEAYADHCRAIDHDKLAERIAEATFPEVDLDSPLLKSAKPAFDKIHADLLASRLPVIQAILAPILARNAAMESALRECKGRIKHFAGCPSTHKDEPCNCGAAEIESSIDELTAKGADNA